MTGELSQGSLSTRADGEDAGQILAVGASTYAPAPCLQAGTAEPQNSRHLSPVERGYEALGVEGTRSAYAELDATLEGLARTVVETLEEIVPHLARMQALLSQRGADRRRVLRKAGLPTWSQWAERYATSLRCTLRTIQRHILALREGHGQLALGPGTTAVKGGNGIQRQARLDARQQAELVNAHVSANGLAEALKGGEDWHAALADFESAAVAPDKLESWIDALALEPDWKGALSDLVDALGPSARTLPASAASALHAARSLLGFKPHFESGCVGTTRSWAEASVRDAIINGNCLDVLPSLPSDSVDPVVTSPPYAGKRANSYPTVPPEEYVGWFLRVAGVLMRVLKPTGSFILNIKEGCEDGERQDYVLQLLLAMRRQGWRWVEEYVWNKANPFPSSSPRRLKDGFERCLHFAKTEDFLFFPDQMRAKSASGYAAQARKLRDQGRRSTGNGSGMSMRTRNTGDMVRPSTVITFPSSCISIGHPAAFPVALPEFFIRLMTKPGGLVLDPFRGGGTTTLAAKKLGRPWIGIEFSEESCRLASKRLSEATRGPVPSGLAVGRGEVLEEPTTSPGCTNDTQAMLARTAS